ncbi:MAG TPA: YceI family protein [Chloroflexota bacterium]|nr:YceI family protein [Chloroflexota bacterium]
MTSAESQVRVEPQVSTWQIDPKHTLVEFSVRHMMITTVKGRFGDVKGTITLDESDITRSSVEAEIDANSIDTRDEQRDGHLRSPDFFDTGTHTAITFKSTRVERAGSDRLRVIGDLTISGITRDVVLDTEITGRGKTPFGTEVIGFSAQTSISRKDFGLNWNVALEAGGFLVGDNVKISLEIEAVKQ